MIRVDNGATIKVLDSCEFRFAKTHKIR
jgi:hypothetical protein